MDDGGRRHDVRNGGLVVRSRPAAELHARVPRYGRHSQQVSQPRQILLRLLPRLYPRPLSVRLSAGCARQRTRWSRYGQRYCRLQPAQAVDDYMANEAPLRIHHASTLQLDIQLSFRLLEQSPRAGEYIYTPAHTRDKELHDIFEPALC